MAKTVKESYTEQVQILNQANMNGYNRLFGGQLMEWIDVVAAVVARRHSERNVTTAMVDRLEFQKAAYANDTVVLQGHITYAGKTSMDICVNTYVEALSGEKQLINHAHLIMVALDENGRPTPVPELILETDEERAEWEEAIHRRKNRK